MMLQSGLDEKWWADSIECYCYLRSVHDLSSDGKTPCERRFGEPFRRPIIPFGSMIEYHPFSAKDQSGLHQFWLESSARNLPRICALCGGIWKGDIIVADIQELENLDASEFMLGASMRRRSSCQNMVTNFIFPGRRWNSQVVWKRSGFPKNHLSSGSPSTRRRTQR